MKARLLLCACLMTAPLMAPAIDNVALQKQTVTSTMLSFVETEQVTLTPLAPAETTPEKLTMLTLEPGTLKENILRINQALPCPWEIKWQGNNDYHVTGSATVMGKDFYEALGKILQYYPVHAEFYTKNHVLLIIPGKPL